MSIQEALINFAMVLLVMPPFMLLGMVIFRKSRYGSKTGADRIRRLKIQIPAVALVLLGSLFIIWGLVNVLLALR